MKKIKKIFALLIAMVMVLGMSVSVLAAELPGGTKNADKTITIKSPANIAADAVSNYTVYKVFDATVNESGAISYKLMAGTTAPAPFIADVAGNVYLGTTSATATGATGEIKIKVADTGAATDYVFLTPQTTDLTTDQITALQNYASKVEVGMLSITGPSTEKTVTVPDYGYYFITTSTGTAVTINSTKPYANVIDKNVITPPRKKITGVYNIQDGTINEGSFDADGQKALAQLGSKVKYEATVTKSHGAKKYVFHDVMGTGLTYNNDVKVYNGTTEVEASATTFDTTTAPGDTITITFVDSYIQGLADGTVLTIKYSGTVNSDALTVDTGKNTASLQYGDNNQVIPSPDTPVVYNARITVTKVDGNRQPLGGAGFILKNNVDNTYYVKSGNDVNWGAEAEATVLTTEVQDGAAVIEFTGLKEGEYTLIEKIVPSGYNQAADETFTISAGNYTDANLKLTSTVINNQGSVLPSTGGIGTTIFYIIGAILVIGAGVVLVTRRRMNAQ